MTTSFKEFFDKYNNTFKPLISEIEGRLEKFAYPLLFSLTHCFDYLAISRSDQEDEHTKSSMEMADKDLNNSIALSYMYIIYGIKKDVEEFDNQTGKKARMLLDKGKFYASYNGSKKSVKNRLKKVHKILFSKFCFFKLRKKIILKKENIDYYKATNDLKNAYAEITKLERMISAQKPYLPIYATVVKKKWMTPLMWIASIAIALAWTYFATKYPNYLMWWKNN